MKKSRPTPVQLFDRDRLAVFDSVKLDLAVMALVALAALLLIARLDAPHWFELLLLATIGLGGAIWLMLRTHRVARAFKVDALECPERGQENGDGP